MSLPPSNVETAATEQGPTLASVLEETFNSYLGKTFHVDGSETSSTYLPVVTKVTQPLIASVLKRLHISQSFKWTLHIETKDRVMDQMKSSTYNRSAGDRSAGDMSAGDMSVGDRGMGDSNTGVRSENDPSQLHRYTESIRLPKGTDTEALTSAVNGSLGALYDAASTEFQERIFKPPGSGITVKVKNEGYVLGAGRKGTISIKARGKR